MSVLLVIALAVQDPVWQVTPAVVTVGDTVMLARGIVAAPGARARPQPLSSAPSIEPLAEPVVSPVAGGIVIRYVVSLFEAGRQPVAMPAIELLHADGRVETVPGDTAWVLVASVLPAGDTLPEPRGSLSPIPRRTQRTWPALLLPAVVLAGTLWWAVARRTTRSVPAPLPEVRRPDADSVLPRWVAAGEARAAAALGADQLRECIARVEPAAGRSLGVSECLAILEQQRSNWPIRRLAETLRALDRAAYAPAVGMDVLLQTEQALALVKELTVDEETPA